MKKEMSYTIGNIGVVLLIITILSITGKLLFFDGNIKTMSVIYYIVAGIGLCLATCPIIFGYIPRPKQKNLDFPYYPPRY